MTDERRRGRAWKPDASGKRCLNCARPWGGHAARSCYPVPAPAIDAFASSRPDLSTSAEPPICESTRKRATSCRSESLWIMLSASPPEITPCSKIPAT